MKVFILHGWAYDTKKWAEFVELLKAAKFEPVILKIPGLTARLKEAWSIDDYVWWLGEQLPKEPVILLGHSNGGRIALNFAAQFPDRVKQLVLIDSAGVWRGGWTSVKRAVFGLLAKIGRIFTRSEHLRSWLYKLARARDYHEAEPHMRQTLTNLIESDKYLNLLSIATPTLIIWGSLDTVTPLRDGVAMHRDIEGSQFEIIDEARHSPMFTHPEAVVSLIGSYLKHGSL